MKTIVVLLIDSVNNGSIIMNVDVDDDSITRATAQIQRHVQQLRWVWATEGHAKTESFCEFVNRVAPGLA
jgi:hypothetical protein